MHRFLIYFLMHDPIIKKKQLQDGEKYPDQSACVAGNSKERTSLWRHHRGDNVSYMCMCIYFFLLNCDGRLVFRAAVCKALRMFLYEQSPVPNIYPTLILVISYS